MKVGILRKLVLNKICIKNLKEQWNPLIIEIKLQEARAVLKRADPQAKKTNLISILNLRVSEIIAMQWAIIKTWSTKKTSKILIKDKITFIMENTKNGKERINRIVKNEGDSYLFIITSIICLNNSFKHFWRATNK